MPQASLLDLSYLLTDEPQVLHLAMELGPVLGGIGSPSGVHTCSRCPGAFLSFGLKMRMPSRARTPFMR